jgi:hypothetical protein
MLCISVVFSEYLATNRVGSGEDGVVSTIDGQVWKLSNLNSLL